MFELFGLVGVAGAVVGVGISLIVLIEFHYLVDRVGRLVRTQQHIFYFQSLTIDMEEDYVKRLHRQGIITKTMKNELLEED